VRGLDAVFVFRAPVCSNRGQGQLYGEVRLQNRDKLLSLLTATKRGSERSEQSSENSRATLGLGKSLFATVKRLSTGLRLATIVLTAIILYASVLKKSGKTLAIFTISIVTLLALSAAMCGAKPPATQKQIFTRGTIVAHSIILGLSGQPAYVVSARGTNTGILITDISDTGLGAAVGIGSGDVLLSINDRVVQTARDADRILSQTPTSLVKICFVHAGDNGLQVYNGQLRYANQNINIDDTGDSSAAAGTAKSTAYTAAGFPQVESFMVEVINRDRAKYGAPPVAENSTLKAFARSRSDDMVKRGYFGHNDPDGVGPQEKAEQAGIKHGVWENISYRTPYATLADTAAACEKSMMSEPPGEENHRSNILNPKHKTVGVGLAIGKRGVVLMTEEFSHDIP
jgi:uncharacterized protein YkwD